MSISVSTTATAAATRSEQADKAPEPWVSVKTAAEHFELSTRTVNRLIAAGAVPVLQIGRSNRVRLSDLEATGTYFAAVS